MSNYVYTDVGHKISLLKERVREAVVMALRTGALKTESEAKRRLTNADPYPAVDTGRLRASYHTEFRDGGLIALVGSNVKYAPYIEHGTGPHTPPLKPLLEWVRRKMRIKNPSKGYAAARGLQRAIQQRGTPARPHLKPAFDIGVKVIKQALRRVRL